MYNKIINPKTGRKVSVKSRAGINVLRGYIRAISNLTGGAAAKVSTESNGVYTFDDSIKIVVMGDIHGDYGALINCLTLGGLIQPTGRCACTHGHHEDECEIGQIERWRRGELPDEMTVGLDVGEHSALVGELRPLPEPKRKLSKLSLENTRWIWTGGDSVLVILGDMVDRRRSPAEWDDYGQKIPSKIWESHGFGEFLFEEEIIQRVINNLRDQAETYGGKIIKVIGNHEALNMTLSDTDHIEKWSNFRYVSVFAMSNETAAERFEKYSPGGLMLNLLKGVQDDAPADTPSRNLHGVAKVGNWIFLHAGLMADALRTYLSDARSDQPALQTRWTTCIEDIDTEFQKYLTDPKDPALRAFRTLLDDTNHGILWSRHMGGNDDAHPHRELACTKLNDLRSLLGDSELKMGVAHCVQAFKTPPIANSGQEAYILKNYIDSSHIGTRFGQTIEDDGTVVPQLCGSTENPWGKEKCFSGITHICAGDETYSVSKNTLTFSNEGNVWRTDVGMSRGFDLAAPPYYEFLKSIAKWNRGEISAPFEELPPGLRGFVTTIRKFFLERRPQILITNNSGLRTEVIKSNTSLRRPGICPYEHKPDHVCDLCHSLRNLDIESFIKKEDDAITAFANLGGERLPLAPIAVGDEEEVFSTADSDSLLEDSEEDWG